MRLRRARSADIGRYDYLDRFRLDAELRETRQGSTRYVVCLEKVNLAGGERRAWQELEQLEGKALSVQGKRMSEHVNAKLRETEFFFQKLVSESEKVVTPEPEAFLYYLNAFLVAGESVRYLLEGKGYDWREWGTEEERGFLTFMNEQRSLVVHDEGGAETEVDWVFVPFVELRDRPSHPAYGFHVFAPPGTDPGGIGRRTYFFKIDGKDESVIECCKRYLTLVETLVGEFTRPAG